MFCEATQIIRSKFNDFGSFKEMALKKLSAILFILSGVFSAFTQTDSCHYVLSGTIAVKKSQETAAPAKVYAVELDSVFVTDIHGHFAIPGLCSGVHKLIVTRDGYMNVDTLVSIKGNDEIRLQLRSIDELPGVVVQGHQVKKQEVEALQRSELTGADLDKVRGATLGETLKNITGITTIQTGPSISKPMIHGMYGNRILILNNGVRLEGQNWGSEHAPEIDPFIATKLSVIKGPASIRYGMDALAGVVLVDPKDLPEKKSIRGEVNLVGASNGRSGTGSGFLEGAFGKKLAGLSWRVQGTLKQSGAYKTPTYYLTNSAVKENDYSATLGYKRKHFGVDFYYSSFNSKIGIYAGSYVGNLNDLLYLFNSPQPIVESRFSYAIQRGYQTVNHQTLKAKGYYQFRRFGKLVYTFARQENKRSEYGEDLSYNQELVDANIPDAYFQLVTHTSDLVLEHRSFGYFSGSIGVSYITQGNVYRGLDYRALIPNFRNYSGGIFLLEKWSKGNWLLEGGVRYDYKWMRTYTEDFTTQQFRSSDYNWDNFSGSLGATYTINPNIKWNAALSSGWRPPSPIELFANGVHQSAASFEIGDTTLKSERTLSLQSYINFTYKRFRAEVGGYFTQADNFIYLSPRMQPVVTISGTYPAFEYKQGNVYYAGIDAHIDLEFVKNIHFVSKSTIIYAYNRTIHDYLIYTPSNRFENGLSYTKDTLWKLRQVFMDVSVLAVTKQTHVPPNSDYVAPPAGYMLLNAGIGFSIPFKGELLGISFSANNILNTVYRDYLNRFRYYSNDLGRNFTLRLKVPFSILKPGNEK